MNSPYFIFCICGKDDDYMPDFYSIETTINYICGEIDAVGKRAAFEIIFVDWGSKKPIHERVDLSANFKSLVNFLYVSENYIKDTPYNCKNIPTSYALNLAIRRANGKYIFVTSADTILNASSLLSLYNICSKEINTTFDSEKAYLTIGRKHIPGKSLLTNQQHLFLKNYLERKGHELRNDFRFLKWGGSAGFIGMHRDNWQFNQGLDEDIIYYGANDVEIFLRATNHCEHIKLSNLGICSFHMEHPPDKRMKENKYNGKNYDIYTVEDII